jgi:hypothetical protein
MRQQINIYNSRTYIADNYTEKTEKKQKKVSQNIAIFAIKL